MTEKCCFCGTQIPHPRHQNNPAPVKDKGWCCTSCNAMIVIPARINRMVKDEYGDGLTPPPHR